MGPEAAGEAAHDALAWLGCALRFEDALGELWAAGTGDTARDAPTVDLTRGDWARPAPCSADPMSPPLVRGDFDHPPPPRTPRCDRAKRRVLIAEDQHGMRGLVHQLIDLEADLEVVAEATTGQEALDLAASDHPDVIVLDLGLPVLDGEIVLERLRATQPAASIVVLSGQASAIIGPRLLEQGAGAVVEKGTPHWEAALVAGVRGLSGTSYRAPEYHARAG